MTVTVLDKYGKTRLTQRATDGSDCKGNSAHVSVASGSFALAISFRLESDLGEGLEDGRYRVVATLDTLDEASVRPTAGATIDIKSASREK